MLLCYVSCKERHPKKQVSHQLDLLVWWIEMSKIILPNSDVFFMVIFIPRVPRIRKKLPNNRCQDPSWLPPLDFHKISRSPKKKNRRRGALHSFDKWPSVPIEIPKYQDVPSSRHTTQRNRNLIP